MATAKRTAGRPKAYREAGFLGLRGEKAELRRAAAFALWRSEEEGRQISIARALLDALFESPLYARFRAAKKRPRRSA